MAGTPKSGSLQEQKIKEECFAYEALNQERVNIFSGGSSCGKKNHYLAIQGAVSEAVFKAKELGFNRILILSNSKGLDQICNHSRKPAWLKQTLYSDLQQLNLQVLFVSHLLVPSLVTSHVLDLAYITTFFPVHHCRLNPELFVSIFLCAMVLLYGPQSTIYRAHLEGRNEIISKLSSILHSWRVSGAK